MGENRAMKQSIEIRDDGRLNYERVDQVYKQNEGAFTPICGRDFSLKLRFIDRVQIANIELI